MADPVSSARDARRPMRPAAEMAAEADAHDMPLPHDARTVFLGGLFFLACVAAMSAARDIMLPLVLALVLKLLLQPLVRTLERVRIPKAVGALVALLLLLGVFAGLGAILSGPASSWARDLPNMWPKLQDRLAAFEAPFAGLQHAMERLDLGDAIPSVSSLLGRFNPASIIGSIARDASFIASHLLEMVLILFYFLVFGETFMRRVVEILPSLHDKRQAVELSTKVEHDLSAYLLTVTLINAVVGAATAATMSAFGVPGGALWAVVAFCLNYIPILGPFTGVAMFAVVGLLALGPSWHSLLPAVAYLGIHVLEGEIITPMLLARRFTINPIAVMVGLVFWYWMWGVIGAILAVPLLAITKTLCDELRPFRALGHLLEG